MPKKKSVQTIASRFLDEVASIETYLSDSASLPAFKYLEYSYDYAALWLYMGFEHLMLQALVGAINNNTAATIGARTGVSFPRHLSDEACEYLVSGDGYFDFKGRDGLIRILKRFLPATHYLVAVVTDPKYKASIDRLIALRNFAAHGSSFAQKRARTVLGVKRLKSAGAWLCKSDRFKSLASSLKLLAEDLQSRAPY